MKASSTWRRSYIVNSPNWPKNIDFRKISTINKTPQAIAIEVNKYIQFHWRHKVKHFHLFCCPPELTDIKNWVAFEVANEVEELKLKFSMGFD